MTRTDSEDLHAALLLFASALALVFLGTFIGFVVYSPPDGEEPIKIYADKSR